MKIIQKSYLIGILVISFFSTCKATEIAEPLKTLSTNADDTDRFDPRDSGYYDDQTIYFTDGDPFTCSFFRVETKGYNVKLFSGDKSTTNADLLVINFISEENLYDVSINILEYGEIVSGDNDSTGIFVTNITKSFGNVKENQILSVNTDDYGKSNLIPEGVQKFRVLIRYRSVSGGSMHYSNFFLWEDQTKTDISERWNIGYGGNLADVSFVSYFGDTSGFNSYISNEASVNTEKETATINGSGVIAIVICFIISFPFIKAGFFLIMKFSSFAVEFTGAILIYIGVIFIMSAIGLLFDIPYVKEIIGVADNDLVSSSVIGALKFTVDPFGLVL